MKISEKWLRQWVDLSHVPELTTDALAEQLTMAGLEIDGIESVASNFSGVVVGKVVEVAPHPDADKLRVTQVDVGQVDIGREVNQTDDADSNNTLLQIVCGAPNVYAGMLTPVALVGAILPSADADTKPFKIKKSKLRGVASKGMLCGASEIGLPDAVDGLLELPSDAPVGMDIREYLQLDAKILDVSITPNRGDCFSVRGLARELAVINAVPLTPPAIIAPSIVAGSAKTKQIDVTAVNECPRYLLQPISNINRDAPTPAWMAQYLLQSGVRSHNFLVDVTNYVMLELGQPLHAFDADKVIGDITVRLASSGEQLTLLNEQTVTLTGDELVIADEEGVLALAGIMGGMRSSVTDTTTNIILESAFFDPLAIAGRARRFKLHTDASQRFERGVDFDISPQALARASQLLVDMASGNVGSVSIAESDVNLPKREPITLMYRKVADVLGIEIALPIVTRILTDLGIVVTQEDTSSGDIALICRPPSHRFDLSIPQDLIEEIARIFGYDNIPSQLPNLQVDMSYDDSADLTLGLKLALADAGYMEAISFSFSDAKIEAILDDKALGNVLPLANPISSDLAVMRRTLLSSLLPCVQYNLNRNQARVRFFEVGLSFVGATVSELVQTPTIALVATGDIYPEQAYDNHTMGFFDLKHDIEQLLPSHIVEGNRTQRLSYQRSKLAFLHPGQSANIMLDGKAIGWLGQLHPTVAEQLDLPVTWVAQIALEPTLVLGREKQDIVPLSKFPHVRRDIALLVDADIEREALSATITEAGGALLERHWLFDVYQGEHTPDGMRSVAFALIWQDPIQTLSEEAIKEATQKVIVALESEHAAQLRDGDV